MGTSARESTETQALPNSLSSPEVSEVTTESPASVSPPTPQTDDATARALALMEQQLTQAHTDSQRLQERLDSIEAAKAAGEIPKVGATEFFANPIEHITRIIREETAKAVKPLNEFKDSVEHSNKYEAIKKRFANDPRYKDKFPQIESYVDQMMAGRDPTNELMNAMILGAIGAMATGQIEGVTVAMPTAPTKEVTKETTTVTMPAHLSPSKQVPAGEPAKAKLRDLDENEERLRRQSGMTREDWLAMQAISPQEVPTTQIGKPKKEEPVNTQSQVMKGVK
jgi:hypothetical protein